MKPYSRLIALQKTCVGLTIFWSSTNCFSASWKQIDTVSTSNLNGLNCTSIYTSVSSPLKVGLCRKSSDDSLAIYTSKVQTHQNLVRNIQNLGDAESGDIRGFVRETDGKGIWKEILLVDHRDEASCYGTLVIGINQSMIKVIGSLPFSVSNTETDGAEHDDCLGPYGNISDNESGQPVLTFKARGFQQMNPKTGLIEKMDIHSMQFRIEHTVKRMR